MLNIICIKPHYVRSPILGIRCLNNQITHRPHDKPEQGPPPIFEKIDAKCKPLDKQNYERIAGDSENQSD